jgi:PIN domain nuclease of toxin-antitoxin system
MVVCVLDSSALLAVIYEERGFEIVRDKLAQSIMSAVNMAEVISKLSDDGFDEAQTNLVLADFKFEINPFDERQARIAGNLRPLTKHKGLSLGDRACLALAIQQKATVLTADRAWAEINVGVKIEVVR